MDLHSLSLRQVLRAWDEIEHGPDGKLAAVRALCRLDRFYLLVKVCRREDLLHPWIYERCREVEASPDGHLDLWAREHGKSSIITFGGIIQEILRDPEITVGIFSHTSSISRGFLGQIKRELEQNTVLHATFPDILYGADPSRAGAASWSLEGGITVKRKGNPKEATVEGWGVVDGQPIGKHYRLRVYDDLVVPESVSTPEQTTKTTNAYSLSHSLGTEGGRIWAIGTRYSYADTYNWIIERKALSPRIYPATHNGLSDGDPVLFSPQEWKKRKIDHTDHDIACQYLQNPIAGEHRMFNVEQLKVYEVRPETLNVYIVCDPARSNKKDSANSAYAVIGVDYAGNKYLLDGINHRLDLANRWLWLAELYKRWRRAPGVSSVRVGYEAFGAQADLDYFQERQKVAGPMFEIVELKWPRDGLGSKVDRVQRLGPDFKMGRFYLPYPTDSENLTSLQRRMDEQGYGYRISQKIRRKDQDNNLYDLAEQFKQQVHYFPFGGLKDLVDAVSRIYDMEITKPSHVDNQTYEPEYT